MARKPTIADVLGFGGVPKRDLTQGFRREISKIKPGQKLQGSISRARPTAAQELAQLLTPDTRFGAQLSEKIAPAVEMSPLGLLTGLVDARRQYQAGNTGASAATGLLAALGAVPGGKFSKALPASADEYIKAINPTGKRILESERPNLGMGDMYGMLPKGAKKIAEKEYPNFGKVKYMSSNGDVYAVGFNPDLGEDDVLGYAMSRGDGTELALANELQGLGIGSELSYLYRSKNPLAPSGGLTEAGEKAARKAYQRMMGEK